MYRHFFKRVLDVLVALVGCPFFLIAFLFLAPVIFLTDKGPIFYCAPRIGKKGKIFKMIKFRSMKVNAPDLRNADGSTFNSAHDPRVTKIGRIMRKTSLDELPQFINVLIGDMSVVGPRPRVGNADYKSMDELRRKGLSVRPGITGYSQAYFRNSISQEEKFKNDAFYAENVSFILDVKVFFKTITSVFSHRNINSNADSDTIAETRENPVRSNTNK